MTRLKGSGSLIIGGGSLTLGAGSAERGAGSQTWGAGSQIGRDPAEFKHCYNGTKWRHRHPVYRRNFRSLLDLCDACQCRATMRCQTLAPSHGPRGVTAGTEILHGGTTCPRFLHVKVEQAGIEAATFGVPSTRYDTIRDAILTCARKPT